MDFYKEAYISLSSNNWYNDIFTEVYEWAYFPHQIFLVRWISIVLTFFSLICEITTIIVYLLFMHKQVK